MVTERFIEIEGRRVRYLEAGEGIPVLLLHAFPLSADMWRPQLEAVPSGCRAIAPDLRGFGRSERGPAGATSVDMHARDVVALADALELDRFIAVGLSMGGYIAFALWRLAAERIRGLLLADTRAEADTDEGRAARLKMRASLAAAGPAAVADAMIPKLMAPATLATAPQLVSTVRDIILANSPAAIDDAIQTLMTRPDSTPLLSTIDVPTLLVAGEEDALTPLAGHEAMHRAIPGSMLAIIFRAGHLSNLERPLAFGLTLAGFAGLFRERPPVEDEE